ncbi:DUF4097 family beta strand repeat-containing protein [Pleionea sediminis]|uniref:DUF4097 family beta strand repeat-containing protein n=1 Tax=Pleionea sediminis TaxID=2569479 RepID=UPI001186C830|nr:DUF4097 family beta strand repeat-containing protein [Pleionea sediminis]
MSRWVLIIVLLTLANVCFAIEESIDATGIDRVTIEVMRGDVTLKGTDLSRVSVTGKIDSAADDVIFEKRGTTIVFIVEMPQNSQFGGAAASRLQFEIPSNIAVSFKSVQASVKLDNFTNGAQVETVSGDISGDAIVSSSKFASVSGDIILKAGKGDLLISNVSGEIKVDSDAQALKITTVSGDVDLNLPKVSDFSLTCVSADVKAKFGVTEAPNIKMTSVNGEIDLDISDDVDALVTLKTGPGGDIINQLTQQKPSSSFVSEQSLTMRLKKGQGVINLSTVSGDLILR